MLKKAILFLLLLLFIVPAATVFADDGNLLKNGDFEGGISDGTLPDGWFSEMWVDSQDYTQIEVTQIDGNNVLRIDNNFENDARIAQNVSVRGNKTYKLSGYVFSYGVSGGQGANLSFEDIMATSDTVMDSGGEWVYVEMYGKTSLLQRNVKVYVRVGGYGALSTGEAFFDNIVLEEVKDVPKGAVVHSLKKPKPEKPESEKSGTKFMMPSLLITFLMVLIYFLFKKRIFTEELEQEPLDIKSILGALLAIGIAIRVALAISIRGYPNDISCWLGWSNACTQYGLFNIYHSDIWIDYPPGYVYILNILGYLMKAIEAIFGPIPDRIQWLIVKIPPIAADIALSLIIFKRTKVKLGEKKALIIMGIYFLSPAVILNSSAWGQIDGVLALCTVIYLLALYDRKFWLGGILLGVGVLMKVQMILFAPLYLTAAWSYFKEKKGAAFAKDVLMGVATGIATLAIFGLPFYIGEGRNPMDFFQIYLGSLDTYNHVSINATNFWALLGGNWTPVSAPFLGLTYKPFTEAGLVLSILVFLAIGFLDRKKEHIFMHAALLITGIFMFSGKMHERYMFPAIVLLLMSVVYTERRSSFNLFIIYSVTMFINTALVLANEHISSVTSWAAVFRGAEAMTAEKALIIIVSLVAVISYGYMIYVCLNMRKNKPEIPLLKLNGSSEKRIKIESEEGFFKKLTRWDIIIMSGLTFVYAILAFTNLGSLSGPETNFKTITPDSSVIIDFGEQKNVSEMWFFRAKSNSNASFYVGYSDDPEGEFQTENYVRITYGGMFDDTEEETAEREKIASKFNIQGDMYDHIMFSNYPDVLKWFDQKVEVTARYAKITFEKPSFYMFEIGFKDPDGNVIPISDITYDKSNENMDYPKLFDEQDTIPEYRSHMNSTYFDEIYHAGTAWEHINYIEPYETTHPPLGKVIMSWGIRIFGLNTFGWRFMGTLVGVLMVPAMYLLAKLLLKKTKYAAIAAFLFTFDFMHFVQTRIATIDSYGVLFIMLMYLFMGIYYYMSYNKSPLIKTLIPLGLSGIFFGLGAASKWICLYAGAGLAVIFFLSMYKRWKEYNYAKNDGTGINPNLIENIKRTYGRNTMVTLAWCVLFFIVLPIGIYVASYIPIMKIGAGHDLSYVWRNQVNMYNYHSGLTSDHPFASPWYEWPLIIKPMWFYSNDVVRGTGRMASIATFGNPAVWWAGTLAMIYLFVNTYLQRKPSRAAIFVIIAFLSQYLPWVLVPRSMFIYHYFASVPFIVIAIVYAIRNFDRRAKNAKRVNIYIIIYLSIVLALFALFYPVMTGTVIPSWYGKLLKWMPTWWFLY